MSSIASPDQNIDLGQRLTKVRGTTGLSQAAFANTLGLSLRAYANYERGEREMPVALFRALYEIYGIDPVWLLAGPGEDPVKAATRTMDFALVDTIVQCVDTELAAMGRVLKPAMRQRILRALYALSAEKGHLEPDSARELLSIAVRR